MYYLIMWIYCIAFKMNLWMWGSLDCMAFQWLLHCCECAGICVPLSYYWHEFAIIFKFLGYLLFLYSAGAWSCCCWGSCRDQKVTSKWNVYEKDSWRCAHQAQESVWAIYAISGIISYSEPSRVLILNSFVFLDFWTISKGLFLCFSHVKIQ